MEQHWTPPLFTYEHAQEPPPIANTDPEQGGPPSVPPHHQSSGPQPLITTRSGRVVKPVQRYGRTGEVCDELN